MYFIYKQLQFIVFFIVGDDIEIWEVLYFKNDGVGFGFSLVYVVLQFGEVFWLYVLYGCLEIYIIVQGQGKAFVVG